MALFLKLLATLVTGVALGVLATWLAVVRPGMGGAITNGPWRTSLSTGSAASGPYTRAATALHGLLALRREETIYFTAITDSNGEALSGACNYRLTGRDPEARWWSITAYGPDDYLIPNGAHRYSISASSVARGEDGSFIAAVSRGQAGANWIPVADGPFTLTLRLYNPGYSVQTNPGGATLPRIAKVSCG